MTCPKCYLPTGGQASLQAGLSDLIENYDFKILPLAKFFIMPISLISLIIVPKTKKATLSSCLFCCR